MCIPIVTPQEKTFIAQMFAEHELGRCLDAYREFRSQMLEVKAIAFPYSPELMRAVAARREWSEASKRVKELCKGA